MGLLPQPNLLRFDRSVRFATLKRTKEKYELQLQCCSTQTPMLRYTNPKAVVAAVEPYKVRSKCAFRYAQSHGIKIKINPKAGVAQPGQRRKVEGLVS